MLFSVAEVGQHKALPLLAVASGCGPAACNAITTDRPEPFGASQDRPVEGLCRPTSVGCASRYHHSRDSALLSGIEFSQGNKSVAEVGQHKALPLLAVASGCGPAACNASLMQAYVCQLLPAVAGLLADIDMIYHGVLNARRGKYDGYFGRVIRIISPKLMYSSAPSRAIGSSLSAWTFRRPFSPVLVTSSSM